MSYKLTDEQLMVQSMVREFSRKVVAATAAERDKTKEFPAENLRQMGELGLMGMMIPIWRRFSAGNALVLSLSAAVAATTFRENSRTMLWTINCSSVSL